MDGKILAELLPAVNGIAVEAGRAILRVRDRSRHSLKADGSPLTEADTSAHDSILEGLSRFSAWPIISEEDSVTSNVPVGDTYWLVDPLDGTKEFINGFDDFTVNVALIEKGVPQLGVVYAPASGALFYAAAGDRPFLSERGGAPVSIAARRESREKVALVSRSHSDARTEGYLAQLGVTGRVRMGSSLKICAVASGAADIYPRLGPTCYWDTAAGWRIARAAGCGIVDLQGQELSYDPGHGLLHQGFIVWSPHTVELSLPEPEA